MKRNNMEKFTTKKAKITASLVVLGAIVVSSIATTTLGAIVRENVNKASALATENERLEETLQERSSLTKLSTSIDGAGFVKAKLVFVASPTTPLASR